MRKIPEILAILLKLKEESKKKESEYLRKRYGLCYNLQFRLQDKDASDKFMTSSIRFLNGGKFHNYPVESSVDTEGNHRRAYELQLNKYDPNNKFGKQRLELLDNLIELCHYLIDISDITEGYKG